MRRQASESPGGQRILGRGGLESLGNRGRVVLPAQRAEFLELGKLLEKADVNAGGLPRQYVEAAFGYSEEPSPSLVDQTGFLQVSLGLTNAVADDRTGSTGKQLLTLVRGQAELSGSMTV